MSSVRCFICFFAAAHTVLPLSISFFSISYFRSEFSSLLPTHHTAEQHNSTAWISYHYLTATIFSISSPHLKKSNRMVRYQVCKASTYFLLCFPLSSLLICTNFSVCSFFCSHFTIRLTFPFLILILTCFFCLLPLFLSQAAASSAAD